MVGTRFGTAAWGLAGNLCLLAASLRHNLVWGEGRDVAGVDLAVLLGVGEGLGLVAFALLAGLSYARGARAAATLPPERITRGGIVLLVAATAVPPFLSTDVFDNLARGRVEAVHGANPYAIPPAQYPEDPFVEPASWTSFGNPYGPISTLVQTGLCLLVGDRVWLGVYAFKILCALCHFAAARLVYRTALRLQPQRAPLAYYLYLCNPAILLETAGHAHNDALMVLGLAAALLALARDRFFAGTFAFGLAVLTKHSIALLGPLLLVLAWRRGRLRAFAAGVAASAVLLAGFVWWIFLESGAVEALVAQAGHQRTSLQHFTALLIGTEHAGALTAAGYGITLLALAWCLPAVRDLGSFGRQSVRLLLVFLLVGMPLFSPWYHLWWLPMVAVWAWPGWPLAFSLVGVLGPLSHLVYATTRSLELGHAVWMWGVGLLPVAAAVLLRSGPERPPV